MARYGFDTVRFDVCGCCLIWAANNDRSGHDDQCADSPEPLALLADFPGALVPGDDNDDHFSHYGCEGCGDLAGQRYELVGLIERTSHPITASIAALSE